MKKTKSIYINICFEGEGVVNFDGKDQKKLAKQAVNFDGVSSNKNESYGKANFVEVGNEIRRCPKVSAACIRHVMWEKEMDIYMPNIMHDEDLLLATIANPASIQRGYLYAKTGATYKRKSPVYISDAVAIDIQGRMETFTTSAKKETSDGDPSSFIKRESRGKLKYHCQGAIDLNELSFISLSDYHGRKSFNNSKVKKFKDTFKQSLKVMGYDKEPFYPEEQPESKEQYFIKRTDIYQIDEQGLRLTDDCVKFLAKDILKRLYELYIKRTSGGWFRTKAIELYSFPGLTFRKMWDNPKDGEDVVDFDEYSEWVDNLNIDYVYEKSKGKNLENLVDSRKGNSSKKKTN